LKASLSNITSNIFTLPFQKWQVAQKCKLEPATTPHEVLGFRDAPLMAGGDTHYYRETSNVSNWLQEHYGMDSLYENLGSNQGLEPVYPVTNRMTAPAIPNGAIKKRPPPPPPKRSEKTQLTTTHWLH
jgi:Ras-associated and pleckstrin homology domains-containing protein 1